MLGKVACFPNNVDVVSRAGATGADGRSGGSQRAIRIDHRIHVRVRARRTAART